VALDVAGLEAASEITRFAYGPADPSQIVADAVPAGTAVNLPASSITLLVLEPA
jgi:hypothetical protein